MPGERKSTATYNIIVLEMDDVVPRRDPLLPNLHVALTTVDLQKRFTSLQRKATPSWLGGNIRSLRLDLSSRLSTTNHLVAKEAMRIVIKVLNAQGYSVNRYRTIWTVYVIELDNKGVAGAEKGYMYVGETSKDPEVRFEEHISGALGGKNGRTKLAARVVQKKGLRLRMDLAPKSRYFSSSASKSAEAAWADYLRELGYKVEGGH